MEELETILKQFETKKNEWKGTWNEEAVAACFKPCAEDILCNGYFLVNNKYIIDLGAIELYYHEEGEDEDKIRDYAMYHIPERYQSPKIEGVIKLENKLPYFELGSFNLHQSGVDVTFEKENEYRASFLIRAYRVLVAEEGGMYPKKTETKYDVHSTHIFDDMFYNGYPTQISWKNNPKNGATMDEPYYRTNLKKKERKLNKKGRYYIETCNEYDTRKWQFKLNIEELKSLNKQYDNKN